MQMQVYFASRECVCRLVRRQSEANKTLSKVLSSQFMTLCVCVFVCELIKEQIRVKLNISYAHLRQEVT